ncbi:MAG: hypothetical protein SGJ11_02860 [Phycisphaerae bacterium]|nr:hypothetical protein [Phycisphaerae bacterium]
MTPDPSHANFNFMDADDFDREAIEADRLLTPEERLALGPQLYREAVTVLEATLRAQFPELGEEDIGAKLIERLTWASTLDESD